MVSGHHGVFREEGNRIIIDKSGGRVGVGRPLQAIVLPMRGVVEEPEGRGGGGDGGGDRENTAKRLKTTSASAPWQAQQQLIINNKSLNFISKIFVKPFRLLC